MRPVINLILKPDKDSTKVENYRAMSLMNIGIKMLRKILVNRIQDDIKMILHCDQVGFIIEMQGCFHLQINKCDMSFDQKSDNNCNKCRKGI